MNKTQCPHCLTVYVISDEQLRISQGMVRCGTCKERFHAEPVSEKRVTQFDPRNVFIEPISEDNEEPDAEVAALIKRVEQVRFKLDDIDEIPGSQPSIVPKDPPVPASDTTVSTPLSADIKDSVDPKPSVGTQGDIDYEFLEDGVGSENHQLNPDPAQTVNKDAGRHDGESADNDANDINLIDEVNKLVEKKIIQPVAEAKTTKELSSGGSKPSLLSEERALTNRKSKLPLKPDSESTDAAFSLEKETKKPARTVFYSLILLIAVGVFSAALIYQLWLKQAISWPDDKRFRAAIAPILEPLKQPLSDGLKRFDIQVPERRNLSRLELLSARVVAHPTRPSTILLRVSLINGAEISQRFPWLELTLNDADGRLVSRRNLSPDDYSHNNRIAEKIGPRELRKVTIELLRFPEHATGYELRLLDK